MENQLHAPSHKHLDRLCIVEEGFLKLARVAKVHGARNVSALELVFKSTVDDQKSMLSCFSLHVSMQRIGSNREKLPNLAFRSFYNWQFWNVAAFKLIVQAYGNIERRVDHDLALAGLVDTAASLMLSSPTLVLFFASKSRHFEVLLVIVNNLGAKARHFLMW